MAGALVVGMAAAGCGGDEDAEASWAATYTPPNWTAGAEESAAAEASEAVPSSAAPSAEASDGRRLPPEGFSVTVARAEFPAEFDAGQRAIAEVVVELGREAKRQREAGVFDRAAWDSLVVPDSAITETYLANVEQTIADNRVTAGDFVFSFTRVDVVGTEAFVFSCNTEVTQFIDLDTGDVVGPAVSGPTAHVLSLVDGRWLVSERQYFEGGFTLGYADEEVYDPCA